MKPRIYQTITDLLLRHLEAGAIPWRRHWTNGLPKSSARQEYRDVNILTLGLAGHTSTCWLTAREVQHLGGRVREGARPSPFVAWRWGDLGEIDARVEAEGKLGIPRWYPYLLDAYNLDQVEGIDIETEDLPTDPRQRLDSAEQLLGTMPNPPEILHSPTQALGYDSEHDRVTLPHRSRFKTAAEYYATLFCGLVHATGHPDRLDRFTVFAVPGIQSRHVRGLIAELGAAFLCGLVGISNQTAEPLPAGTLNAWIDSLRSDPELILRAAAIAQRAADYIRGKVVIDPNAP
jgi:antirestriction protein ArdC